HDWTVPQKAITGAKCVSGRNVPDKSQPPTIPSQPARIFLQEAGTNSLFANSIGLVRTAADQGENKMDRLHFFTPARIARGQGHPIEEVDSGAEAMVFLQKWPVGRRGPVYQCAVNCCSAALSGRMSAEEARKAF